MNRRDQGIVGALIAVFAVLALVIALPSLDLGSGSHAPASGSRNPAASGASDGSTPATASQPPASGDPAGSSGAPTTDGSPGTTGPSSADPGASSPADASPGAPGDSADPGTSPEPGASASADPPVAVIRHGVIGQPTSINPLTARTQPDRDLVALVFSGLVRLGPKDTLLPDLADRWSVDSTGGHWTFHIRPTALWHDGQAVTADDVVFTIQLLRNPAYTGPYRGSWNEITVKKIDAQTVRFDLRTPLGDFLQLARQPLLPVHLLKGIPIQRIVDSAFSVAPVGAGPYRLLQWDQDMAVLERAYPGTADTGGSSAAATAGPSASPGATGAATSPSPTTGPTPDAPRLQLQFYPTAAALADAYRRGEVDMADGLPAATAQELAQLPGTRVIRNPRSTLTAVLFNLRTDHPILRDQNVRQALLKAIDRVTLVNQVMAGFGNRADTLIPPASWAYVKSAAAAVEYSTTRAAAQLKAAGWRKVNGHWHPPGSRNIFLIELITTTKAANPITWATAQFVAASWRSFGITVKVVALAPSVLIGDRLSQASFSAAVVDMNIGLDPDLYPLLASRQAGVGGSNLSGVQSLVLDDLLIAARRPGTLAQRRGAWAKLESFLSDAQVILPLAFRDAPLVVSDRVVGPGVHLQGDLSDRFWDVLTWRLASAG